MFSQHLIGQNDIFSMLGSFNQKYELHEGVRSIKESKYDTFGFGDTTSFDKTIKIEGKEIGIFLRGYGITKFESKGKATQSLYLGNGELTSQFIRTYNQEGQILSEVMDVGNNPANFDRISSRELTYDNQNRLIKVKELYTVGDSLTKGMEVSYASDGLPHKLIVDLGFRKIRVDRFAIGDTTRYMVQMEPETSDGTALNTLNNSDDSKAPKEYIDISYCDSCDCYQYTAKAEDEETSVPYVKSIIKRNKDKKVLSETYFTKDGKKYAHYKFTYTDKGWLKEKKDLLNNISYKNEYYKNGKIKVEFNNLAKFVYEYDDRWNIVKKLHFTLDGKKLLRVTLREIDYQ